MRYGYTYTHIGATTKSVEVMNLGETPFFVNEVYIDSNERKIVNFNNNTNELYFTGQGSLDFVVHNPEAYSTVGNYPIQKYQTHELLAPISKITMYYADDKAFSAGSDNGSELIIDSPWATQATTDYVLGLLDGYEYIPIKASGVYADTAIQLGDDIGIDKLRQTVVSTDWTFDGSGIVNIETPQSNESNYDDPYNTLVQNQFKRKVSLGDSYQGVTIDRQKGLEMLYSPDGTEDNATGKYYADLNKGMAFQYRNQPEGDWKDWLYFDKNEKVFKLALYSKTDELISGILLDENGAEILGKHINITANEEYTSTVGKLVEDYSKLKQTADGFEFEMTSSIGRNLIKNSVMINDNEYWDTQEYMPPTGELYPSYYETRRGYISNDGIFQSMEGETSGNYGRATNLIEINPELRYRVQMSVNVYNQEMRDDMTFSYGLHFYDQQEVHILGDTFRAYAPMGNYSDSWVFEMPYDDFPIPPNAKYIAFSAYNASLDMLDYDLDEPMFSVIDTDPNYSPSITQNLRGEYNSWSLTKESLACITGAGLNKQTIRIDPNAKYTISFDYGKRSAQGSLDIYYVVDNVRNYMIQQTEVVEDATFSVELNELGSENITIVIDSSTTNDETPPVVANLMFDIGKLTRWSPAMGEVYTTNVIMDETGIKVKGKDGLAYTAITPFEFAHYYDNVKRFYMNKDEANFENINVTGEKLELTGGIKFVNMADKVILVNLRRED